MRLRARQEPDQEFVNLPSALLPPPNAVVDVGVWLSWGLCQALGEVEIFWLQIFFIMLLQLSF
ncbi:hypothetical protein AUP44_26085 [Tistrella mobilis]|uniref:Uncharacterized protein n=1 Tax=Tistrella mobilis TaxID=171437 RepID=A0A162L9D2_9PROT|nr:hypothetical protein AUP44_26085 [Tistrella mobilis]